jgi:membrane-associated protease RseP (regulator of RpoE activity)
MAINDALIVLFEVFAILCAWMGLTYYIDKKKWFSKYIEIGSFNLMWIRTRKVQFLDKIKSPERIYKGGSTIGLALVYLIMIAGVLIVISATATSISKPKLPDATVAPNNILLIPGVTDFVPLSVEVILALLILITVHEVAHGVLARIHNIDVKSAGLIWFIVPLGGFVEPDEDQLKTAPLLHKLQVYAAGITVNLITLVGSFFLTVFLVAQTTGVALIKATPALTFDFYAKSFGLLFVLPIQNVLSPNAMTLWITQNTVSWMPTHIEPFFGYWFLLHLAFWTFWISFALVFTNALPLKFTDGGQIFEATAKWALDRVNLGRFAEPLSNNIAILLLLFVCGIFFIPYIYQFLV